MGLFEEFDKAIDVKALAEEEKKVGENDFSNMPEVPDGIYRMKVDKMELKKSKNGNPMVAIQFRITEGDQKNRMVFYNQVISKAFGLHKMNEFLRSMELDCVDAEGDAIFKSFSQYGQLILDAYQEIDENNLEFEVSYYTNERNSDYHDFKIEGVFE